MDKNLRPYLVEMIGTFVLVVVSAGTICSSQLLQPTQPQSYLTAIALAEGFILAVALTATLSVSSGYLNPAITLMLWVFKRLDGAKTCWLIGAQIFGALLAGMVIRLIFSGDVFEGAIHGGTPHLNYEAFHSTFPPTMQVLLGGIGVEVVLTFILTFAIFGTLIDPRAPKLGAMPVGLCMAALVFMGYPLTGAACNPARWLGSVVWEFREGCWRDHAVYWIGPIFGALLAGAVYQYLILPEEEKQAEAPAAPAPQAAPAYAKSKR